MRTVKVTLTMGVISVLPYIEDDLMLVVHEIASRGVDRDSVVTPPHSGIAMGDLKVVQALFANTASGGLMRIVCNAI